MLERFALSHLNLSAGEIQEIFERTADAVMKTRKRIPPYIAEHPEFQEIGERMRALWEEGVRELVSSKGR